MTKRYLMDEWRDAFVTELRMHDVPGRHIGEALAEVDAHCSDSGQTPAEAFGDPVGYAAQRAASLGKTTPGQRTSPRRGALLALAFIAGVVAFLNGIEGVVRGAPAQLTIGDLVVLAVGPVLIAGAITLLFRPGLRHRSRWLAATFAVLILGAMAPTLLLRQVVAHLPAAVLLAAGVALLVAGWWMSAGSTRDPVVDPRSGRERFRLPAWVTLVAWLGPLALIAIAALVIVLV